MNVLSLYVKIRKLAYWDYVVNRTDDQSQIIEKPCRTLDVFIGLPFKDIKNNDEAYVKFYFKSMIKVKHTVSDYGVVTMLAEFGGYTGLLLGQSLVAIASLIIDALIK